MMQKRGFQAARFLSRRFNRCLHSLELDLLSIIEEVGILWKMNGLEEIRPISEEALASRYLRSALRRHPSRDHMPASGSMRRAVNGVGHERGKVWDEQ